MKDHLSVTSRILVAFASGALIAVFFLPAWRIDLFAPQYPEGLTMNIWINNITGDVDVINGLNHYIGMKHITVDMFPEFKYLPYVVGVFMALGMIVSITGKRKFLLIYLVMTVIGGALAMYDFYQWGYKYGHDLDPTAPIQVPGLSYQPPLIGHKRLLNFDAYSFPDAGGWIVIGAAALAFGVWFFEWWRQRKATKRNTKLVSFTGHGLILTLLVASCSPKTEEFNYGKDNCSFCKMGIMDARFGAEIVTKKSKVYKFDDLGCMVKFLQSGTVEEKDIKHKVTINFIKKNDFIDVTKAFFWSDPELRSPMGSNIAAFPSAEAARKVKSGKPGELLSWEEVYKKLQ